MHTRGKPLADGVNLDTIAARTTGFSGASLQNLMNEAAIYAARAEKEVTGLGLANLEKLAKLEN